MPRVRDHKWREFASLGYARFRADQPEDVALDVESTGLTWADTPFGLSVSWRGPNRIESFWFELEESHPLEFARHLIADHTGRFIFHNAKFDIRMLTNFNLWQPEFSYAYEDTLAMVALLEPSGERGLKQAARKYLGVTTNQESLVKQARKELGLKKDDGYWPLPREVVIPYALKDTEYTLRLNEILWPKIAEQGLDYAYERELKLTDQMLLMERRGLQTRPELAKAEIQVCDAAIAKSRAEIETLVGKPVGRAVKTVKGVRTATEFNPDSPKQLCAEFHARGIELTSTSADILSKLEDPLAEAVMQLRNEQKLRGTYLVPLLREADENGILHPNINQYGTGTGRTSSGAVKA